MVLQVNLVHLFFVQRKFKMTVLSFSTFLCMMAIIIVFKNEIISNTEMIKNKNTLFFFFFLVLQPYHKIPAVLVSGSYSTPSKDERLSQLYSCHLISLTFPA